MHADELIARTSPPVNGIGPAFYFTPETLAAGRELGLDGFRLYFLGRGGVLGDVEWSVVASAFGYFKPSLVEKMWTTAKERCTPDSAARAYLACCQEYGRARFADVGGLAGFCEAATAVNDAARADPAALTLWAGLAAAPLADDLPARAMQLVTTLRELRGSAHLVAVVASGLPTPVAHLLRRPDAMASFGWGDGEVRAPTDEDRTALAEADALTDRLLTPAYATLGDDGGAVLVRGLDAMVHASAP